MGQERAESEYRRLDIISKVADGAVLTTIPIYLAHAFLVNLEPNWQSVISNYGLVAIHFGTASGVYLSLKGHLNSRLARMTIGAENAEA